MREFEDMDANVTIDAAEAARQEMVYRKRWYCDLRPTEAKAHRLGEYVRAVFIVWAFVFSGWAIWEIVRAVFGHA